MCVQTNFQPPLFGLNHVVLGKTKTNTHINEHTCSIAYEDIYLHNNGAQGCCCTTCLLKLQKQTYSDDVSRAIFVTLCSTHKYQALTT